MPTKETYQVAAQTLPEALARLNFIFARLADRLDKIEGLRGELETEGATFGSDIAVENAAVLVNDEDGKVIHSLE